MSGTSLLSSSIVDRSESFGGILFDLETKDYFPLNHTAWRLYQLLKKGAVPSSCEDLADGRNPGVRDQPGLDRGLSAHDLGGCDLS